MKIYILSNENYDRNGTVCVSEDINMIRTSICEDFNIQHDYPRLEIWENGKKISETTGNDVLRKVADEMYNR